MTIDNSSAALPESQTQTEPTMRRVPAWLSALIVLLAVGGAGWFVWSTFFSDPAVGKEIEVGNFPRSGSGRIIRPVPPPVDGVTPLPLNIWRIKAGEFSMNLAAQEGPLAPLRVYYGKNDLYPQDQLELMTARRQIVSNTDLSKQLNLTVDQIKKLSEIPLGGQGLKINAADQTRLRTQWQAWLKASDGAAKKQGEQSLLAALRDVGTRSIAPTRQDFAQRAEQVKSILTPQQLEQYRQRTK